MAVDRLTGPVCLEAKYGTHTAGLENLHVSALPPLTRPKWPAHGRVPNAPTASSSKETSYNGAPMAPNASRSIRDSALYKALNASAFDTRCIGRPAPPACTIFWRQKRVCRNLQSASTYRQGSKSGLANADARVLKVKLSLN